MASEQEVRERVNSAHDYERTFKKEQEKRCDCDLRSNNMMGPCRFCVGEEVWRKLRMEGETILRMKADEFQVYAPEFISKFDEMLKRNICEHLSRL